MDKLYLNQAKDLITCFDKENQFYWIEKLVKSGELNQALAGFLCIYFDLL